MVQQRLREHCLLLTIKLPVNIAESNSGNLLNSTNRVLLKPSFGPTNELPWERFTCHDIVPADGIQTFLSMLSRLSLYWCPLNVPKCVKHSGSMGTQAFTFNRDATYRTGGVYPAQIKVAQSGWLCGLVFYNSITSMRTIGFARSWTR